MSCAQIYLDSLESRYFSEASLCAIWKESSGIVVLLQVAYPMSMSTCMSQAQNLFQIIGLKCDIICMNGEIIVQTFTEIEIAQCEVSKVMVSCEHEHELCSNPFGLKMFYRSISVCDMKGIQ